MRRFWILFTFLIFRTHSLEENSEKTKVLGMKNEKPKKRRLSGQR